MKTGVKDLANGKNLLTVNEVSELLSLHPYTVWKWARTGRIPCIKLRRRYRFELSDIQTWKKQHTLGKF